MFKPFLRSLGQNQGNPEKGVKHAVQGLLFLMTTPIKTIISGISGRSRHTQRGWALAMVSALALAGCGTTSTPPAGTHTPPHLAVHSAQSNDYVAGAAYWGARYEQNPSDAEAAGNYARNLRQIGSFPQALMVLQRASMEHPDDPAVLAEYGKTLAANGKPDQAVAILAKAAAFNTQDWSILSAQGVALDAMGRHLDAQDSYQKALTLAPDHPVILTNFGLSLALGGALNKAEAVLRKAVSNPAAGVHARQNLSLVLGLKGDFAEAERLARADLSPDAADNNMAYLRAMLTQPALWKQMEQLDAPMSDTVNP